MSPLLWALLAATRAQADVAGHGGHRHAVCDTGVGAVVPPNQVGQPHAKYQTKCRGAPLLANVAGGLRVVAVDATTTCDGTRPCGFDVVGCGGRPADVSKLVVVAEFVSATARAAAVARIVGVDRLRVEFRPPQPGNYTVTARMQWYDDTCATKGVYLGASESRCRPWTRSRCSTPRWSDACDALTLVPRAPRRFVATGGGGCPFWARAGPRDPWTLHEHDATRRCASVTPPAARLPGGTIIVVGDSIIRQLYGAFVRVAAGVHIDDAKMKEVLSRRHRGVRTAHGGAAPASVLETGGARVGGRPPGTTVEFDGTRVRFAQIWGESDWNTRGIQSLMREPAAVVVANYRMIHQFNRACNGEFRQSLDRGAALGGRTILVAPPALWGLRNPGQTWGDCAAFGPLLASWAREHNASVLDPAPATLARRDATDDGMHYGHGPDDAALPAGAARDVGSVHAALVAKLHRLILAPQPVV